MPAVWPALAFPQPQGAPELITDYLQDEVLADEPVATRRGPRRPRCDRWCTTDDLADATAPVLEGLPSIVRDDVLDRVAELPLVGRGFSGCWPHPVWVRATRSTLNQEERRLVVDGRIAALLGRGAVSEAGRMAVEVAGTDALRAVVRSALASGPVSASVHDLASGSDPSFSAATFPSACGSTPSSVLAKTTNRRSSYGSRRSERRSKHSMTSTAKQTCSSSWAVWPAPGGTPAPLSPS